jgi:oligopeptide transport system ATP-binding protein
MHKKGLILTREILLEAKDLKKYFPISRRAVVKAVENVSFSIRRGETLGLVGESGCGKTTTGRLLLHLLPPTSGEVYFKGEALSSLQGSQRRKLRREMQIVFQDPYSSLNPRMTIGSILSFPMRVHKLYQGQRRERVTELLKLVGMSGSDANRYPHEFSGGQLQRIGIARALAVDPIFIVADEPVSALDVSIQSQILNLFKELKEQLKLTYVFIAHDLSVVEFISDRIAVLYLGKIVELAPADQINRNALHPYTKSLVSAIPLPDPERERRKEKFKLEGDVPSPINPPLGCSFNTRCQWAVEKCRSEPAPELEEFEHGHWVRCWYVREILSDSLGQSR